MCLRKRKIEPISYSYFIHLFIECNMLCLLSIDKNLLIIISIITVKIFEFCWEAFLRLFSNKKGLLSDVCVYPCLLTNLSKWQLLLLKQYVIQRGFSSIKEDFCR